MKSKNPKTSSKQKNESPDRPKVIRLPKSAGGQKVDSSGSSEKPKVDADTVALAGDLLQTGHRAPRSLKPQDQKLFEAFQSNLLSLISHELRTPLMGIMNALALLEAREDVETFTMDEMIGMASKNAHRLESTLAALLDLAEIESGTFRARFREVSLSKLVQVSTDRKKRRFEEAKINLAVDQSESQSPVLADPQKVERAIELCAEVVLNWGKNNTDCRVTSDETAVLFRFSLQDEQKENWQKAWAESVAGYQGGVANPGSAFAGTVQSEERFLTREREGLGSEFLLIHEIMRLHGGKFSAREDGHEVCLELFLPVLQSRAALIQVLESRVYQTSTDLESVALILVQVPKGSASEAFQDQVRESLFRTSDAVYLLPDEAQVAIVMDDCKPEFAHQAMERIQKALQQELSYGVSACPEDGADAQDLIRLANDRVAKTKA